MASAVGRIMKKTASLAGATFASRALGLIRVVLMAKALGGGTVASAWNLAFRIPNLFRRVFGEGLIGTVLITMMGQTIEVRGRDNARKRFSTIFMWLSLILCGCCVAAAALALLLRRFFPQEHISLALGLLPLLMPYCIFICLVGVMTSALNSVKVFFLPAAASLLLNLCLIGALLWVCPRYADRPAHMLEILAYAVLVSGVLELISLLMLMKKQGFLPLLSRRLFKRTRVLAEMWALALPGLLGAVAYQLSVLTDAVIAAWISSYAVAALSYSERLVYLPIGVFAVAMGAVSLAEMTSMAQKRDYQALIATQFASLRYLLFLTVPLALFMALFHVQILRLVYCRGAFDDRALHETASAMFFYCFGIPSFAALKVTLTGFYARKDMKTPMYVSVFCIVLNLILNLLLMRPLKQGGIALATAICSCLNNLILFWLLQRKLGKLPLKSLARFLALLLPVSLAGLYPAKWVYDLTARSFGTGNGIKIFPALAAGALCYLAIFIILAILLKMDELKAVSTRIFRKRGSQWNFTKS